MTQPYYVVSHSTGGRPRHRSEQPADGGMFVTDREKWLSKKRRHLARKASQVARRWEREKRRTAAARGFALLAFVIACLPLGGCPAFVMGVSAAGGVVTFGKDVLDLDTSWNQSHPDKTPIEKALLPAFVVPE